MPNDFPAVFARLRDILRRNTGALSVSDNTPKRFGLEVAMSPLLKKRLPVAWVEIQKNYVSYHLMPVYGCPKLLDKFSKELKSRMQGKSCFNFKTIDADLFKELEQLTVDGIAAFKRAGYGP